jgi:hypothetical protein
LEVRKRNETRGKMNGERNNKKENLSINGKRNKVTREEKRV